MSEWLKFWGYAFFALAIAVVFFDGRIIIAAASVTNALVLFCASQIIKAIETKGAGDV